MATFEESFQKGGFLVKAEYNSDSTWKWKITILKGDKEVDQLRSKSEPEYMLIQDFFGYNHVDGFSSDISRWVSRTRESISHVRNLG